MDDKITELLNDFEKKLDENVDNMQGVTDFFTNHFASELKDNPDELKTVLEKVTEIVELRKGDVCPICGIGKMIVNKNGSKCNNPKCPSRQK